MTNIIMQSCYWTWENCNCDPFKGTSRNGAEELDLEDQEDTCGKGVAHDKAQVNPEAEKVVSESCRLFVHNLPYTATYSFRF